MISAWAATIADPDLADWITVVAYLAAALLALRATGRAPAHTGVPRSLVLDGSRGALVPVEH